MTQSQELSLKKDASNSHLSLSEPRLFSRSPEQTSSVRPSLRGPGFGGAATCEAATPVPGTLKRSSAPKTSARGSDLARPSCVTATPDDAGRREPRIP